MTKTRERYVYTSWPRFGDLLKLWNNCLLQYVALFRLARKSVHIRYTCRDQLSKFLDAQVVWIPLLPCDLASATQEEWLLYIWCLSPTHNAAKQCSAWPIHQMHSFPSNTCNHMHICTSRHMNAYAHAISTLTLCIWYIKKLLLKRHCLICGSLPTSTVTGSLSILHLDTLAPWQTL